MKLLVRIFDSKSSDLDYLLKNSYVSEFDKSEIEKYKIDESKKEKLVSSIFKRKYIGEYEVNEHGKPVSNNCYFNVSHSHGLVAFVMDEVPVGIDVEKLKIIEKNLVNFISNDSEMQYIHDGKSFFEIWTNKESLVKALGTGINKKVSSIPGLPLNGKREFEGKTFASKTIQFKDFIISVTREKDEGFDLEIVKEVL